MSVEKFNVLGVGISALNLDLAVENILAAACEKRKGYVCVTGVHGVCEAHDDPAFRDILNGSFLTTPDGMPMVWLGKYYVGKLVDRVYGPDLMLALCEASQNTGLRHFFYGGAPKVANDLAAEMKRRFPALEVAGTYCPPFRPLNDEEERELAAMLEETADFFWVGLSTPKQERFMAEYLEKLNATIMFGVGAAFDFHTGRAPQAPRWIQRSGFEWLFRLCTNPRRLWKRYLRNNPLFLYRIALQISGFRKSEATPTSEKS